MKKKYIVFGALALVAIIALSVFYSIRTASFSYLCQQNNSKEACLCVEEKLSDDLKKSFADGIKRVKAGEKAPMRDMEFSDLLKIGNAFSECEKGKEKPVAERRDNVVEDLKTLAVNEAEIAKIKVYNPKVRVITGRYAWENKTILSFDVENGTNEPISNIAFHAVLTSEGREIPWIEDRFNYDFAGGLNSKERQHLDLEPNMFSEWGQLKPRNDYKLSLKVISVRGAGGVVLWESF